MAEIKVVLIDDEPSAISVLANLLKRTSSNIKIVATCNNLEEGVEQIKKLQPNAVFLDVQMPNYAGYEIVEFFDIINFEIIFITAYDQYAIKAFELNAIDYLVKPISRKKLASTLLRLEDRLEQKEAIINYQSLLKTIKNKEYEKIVIPELGNRRVVNLVDIIAIEADGAYSIIHLANKTKITTSKNLKHFEDLLLENISFFRSHRAWIINLMHIEFFNKTDLTITLANGNLKTKISRARISVFENII